jgi:hypothetical protein
MIQHVLRLESKLPPGASLFPNAISFINDMSHWLKPGLLDAGGERVIV